MHLLFVLSALAAGGAERVVNILACAAVDRGWTVTIVAFDRAEDPTFHTYPPEVRLTRLGIAAGLFAAAGRVRALRIAVDREDPDVVISFLTKVNAITLAATWGLKVPVIVSERNNPRKQSMHVGWKLALWLLYRRADLIAMQTKRSIGCLPRRERKRAEILPNPVEIMGSPASRKRAIRTISAVGRLTEQKGFDRLIAAFAELVRVQPRARLMIWGEGPLRPALERQIEGLGLHGKAKLAGRSRDHAEWLAQTDLFVLSSRYEGFPNALIEAMAAGLPVVAFDCEFGPAELVRNGENGLLVPDGAVHDLARAMARLMDDSALAKRMGAAARASVQIYEKSRIAGRWLELTASLARHTREVRAA